MTKHILFILIILCPVCFAQSDSIVIQLINGTVYQYAASEIQGITFFGLPTSIEEQKKIETVLNSFTLYQNYPNPFNPSTNIIYDIPRYGSVEIEIYDIQGQLVRSLGKFQQGPGSHIVSWNGQNNSKIVVSSGTYICRVCFENTFLVKKLMLIK